MLRLQEVTIWRDGQALFPAVSTEVAAGQVLCIMGPSGSGKSSLLAYLAGTLGAANNNGNSHAKGIYGSGEVYLHQREMHLLPAHQRHTGMLFQDALLFPHWSIGENILAALPPGKRQARRQAAEDWLAQAELPGYFDRDPASLSGGQQARVALMRTLAAQPQALLLDEPFSKLDQQLRQKMRDWVYQHILQRQLPAILVTHDIADVPAGQPVLHLEQDLKS